MTKEELRKTLETEGVNPSIYRLDGGLPGEKYVLDFEGGDSWITYYSERGLRTNLKRFSTESEACADLLAQVLRDPDARKEGRW